MKLIEIFNHLTYGELSQLNIGGASAGEITEANQAKVVAHINLALSALFTRFPLKFRTVSLKLDPMISTYLLDSAYAESNTESTEPVKYLLDSEDPFTDDVLKIDKVMTDTEYDLPLNDEWNVYSLFSPTTNSLYVPNSYLNPPTTSPDWAWTDTLEVSYRAGHRLIDVNADDYDPETFEVEIPRHYLQALLYNVASRVHTPFGAGSTGYVAGDSFLMRYENECLRLETMIRPVEQQGQVNRIQRNGWV